MSIRYRAGRRQGAFTLIELLVVIAIIALLIGILLPAIGKARQTAQNLRCAANNRSIGQAMLLYGNDYRDWFPVIPVQGDTATPRYNRYQIMLRQHVAGGVAGLFSVFQVGDAQYTGPDTPPIGDYGFIGAFGAGPGRYANGSDVPIMRGYLESLEVLTCPRDKEDRYFGSAIASVPSRRFLQGTPKVPTPPATEQDVISYNISYLYFAGLRPIDPDVVTPPVIWGDETNTNDIATNAFYGYNWPANTAGSEPQVVLDQVGFNPQTGFGRIDNHGAEGGYFVFADGHVEFITKNPQMTFFANPGPTASTFNDAGQVTGQRTISLAEQEIARTENKSINRKNRDRSSFMRTID